MAQSNIQRSIADYETFKQKRRDMWHNDFFASMSNQAFNEPSLSWTEGAPSIDYQGTKKLTDMTTSWSSYAKAAKSRGIIPDYQKFMDTYNVVKASKGTQLLNSMSQLHGLHGDKRSFKLALEDSIRGNETLRDDLMRAVRNNPGNENAAVVMDAIKTSASSGWDRGTSRFTGDAGELLNPMGSAKGALMTGGRALATSPSLYRAAAAGGAKKWGKGFAAAKGLIPGYGTYANIAGMRGKGPLTSKYMGKGFKPIGYKAQKAYLRKPTIGMKDMTWKRMVNNQGSFQKHYFKNVGKLKTNLDALGRVHTDKTTGKTFFKDLKGNKISFNSSKAKRQWFNKVNLQVNKGLKELKSIKPSHLPKGRHAKYLAELSNYKKELGKFGKSKVITKEAMEQITKKGLTQNSGKILNQVIKRVGWGGIVKRAGWKLGAKLAVSGALKALTPATAGVSGLISLGLDAWTAVELSALAAKIWKEEGGKKTFQTGGLTQDLDNIAG